MVALGIGDATGEQRAVKIDGLRAVGRLAQRTVDVLLAHEPTAQSRIFGEQLAELFEVRFARALELFEDTAIDLVERRERIRMKIIDHRFRQRLAE